MTKLKKKGFFLEPLFANLSSERSQCSGLRLDLRLMKATFLQIEKKVHLKQRGLVAGVRISRFSVKC